MSSTATTLPSHLKKYVVAQNYERYTPEEHATWRYLLRQLRDFLGRAAHPRYVEGLKKTGISVDRIPKISEMDELLQKFEWGAVPVSGFIPPAAFMEFQSLGVLPIACDMRSLDHFLYTPAPDIVHEAAGHAPILIDPEYAEYLKSYAQVAKKSIISSEDLDQYEAIRKLSDQKENPNSTAAEIEAAEKKLIEINDAMTHVSEASLLSRMNWWTAEYGLIGTLSDPKIYGAGLLSSLGESRDCLKDHVKKIPLDVSCVDVSYDITEPQPQLFVTPDFQHLHKVLDDLANRLSFRIGGVYGLKQAKKANSVNSVELDSGLQISGVLERFDLESEDSISFLKFSGPTQLSYKDTELDGHNKDYHSHGYSSPLGRVRPFGKPLHLLSDSEAETLSLQPSKSVELEFTNGILLKGTFVKSLKKDDRFILMTFSNCSVTQGNTVLFDPSWGTFDLACGEKVVSVFGGPADRESYGEIEDFVAERVPTKSFSPAQVKKHSFYNRVHELAKDPKPSSQQIASLWLEFHGLPEKTWLMGLEILELAIQIHDKELEDKITRELKNEFKPFESNIEDGIRLAKSQ